MPLGLRIFEDLVNWSVNDHESIFGDTGLSSAQHALEKEHGAAD